MHTVSDARTLTNNLAYKFIIKRRFYLVVDGRTSGRAHVARPIIKIRTYNRPTHEKFKKNSPSETQRTADRKKPLTKSVPFSNWRLGGLIQKIMEVMWKRRCLICSTILFFVTTKAIVPEWNKKRFSVFVSLSEKCVEKLHKSELYGFHKGTAAEQFS